MPARLATPVDRDAVTALLRSVHADGTVTRRGERYDLATLPVVVHEGADGPDGVAAFRVDRGEALLVALVVARSGRGAGTALVEALTEEATSWGCTRLVAVLANDELDVAAFLQRRGFDLLAVHHGALAGPRRHGPPTGRGGVERRHELELERRLG